jgi:methyltransferase
MHPGFWWLLAALAIQRLVELATNAFNTRRLVAQGARVVQDDGYGLLVATHVLLFPLAVAEATQAPWTGTGAWTAVGLGLLVVGELLRAWSMLSLGPRWTTRLVVLPQAPLVARGPYRFLRHPIYVGVSLVLLGFPLAFGLWGTALAVTALNGMAVARRIRREDEALALLRPWAAE